MAKFKKGDTVVVTWEGEFSGVGKVLKRSKKSYVPDEGEVYTVKFLDINDDWHTFTISEHDLAKPEKRNAYKRWVEESNI